MTRLQQHRQQAILWRTVLFLNCLLLLTPIVMVSPVNGAVLLDDEGNHIFPTVDSIQESATSTTAAASTTSQEEEQRSSSFEIIPEEGSTSSSTSSQQRISFEENNDFLGIPGTTQTKNGYDTALGNDPICWTGVGFDQGRVESNNTEFQNTAVQELVKTVFPNPILENFTLIGETKILTECPPRNLVTVTKPIESIRGERLRTLQYYNYTLHVELDLDTLDGDYIVTDDDTSTIALQVVLCSLGKSGFCSPFVHEQANAKEAIEKANSGEEIIETKKKVTGDLHGGTHIHSPWVYLDVGKQRQLNASVTVPMIVNHPGDYFVIGTVQLYTEINSTTAYRWDIANAMEAGDGRYLHYQAPPDIREVSDGVLYFSYAAITAAAAVILFLFGQTLWNRDHQVLQLSQGDFLLVFLLCALVGTCCSFLLVPRNDTYCRINYPLLLIPIQLMYAITVGRMWRIHAVISPLLLEHLSKGNPGIIQRFVQAITYISFKLNNLFVFKKENVRRSTAGAAKQQISQFQLALVVAIFTFPQVVIQIVALILQPQERRIMFDDDESIGRAVCSSDANTASSLVMYSFVMLLLLIVILLVMAHSCRKLPSLFNETRVIYDSTFLSIVLLLLGGAVILLTNAPTTSPDVQYVVTLVLVLSITLNSAIRIMLPKLKMVWKNENVVVSKLVTDHHRKAREKAERHSTLSGVTGFDPTDSRAHSSFTRGDYDEAQQNPMLQTFHSTSNDTGLVNPRSSMASGRSSMNSSDGGTGDNGDNFNSSAKSFSDENDATGMRSSDDFIGHKLEHAIPEDEVAQNEKIAESNKPKALQKRGPDQTSSTDLDIESGESGSAPFDPSSTVDGEVHDDGHTTDGGTTDNERDLEEAAAVASAFATGSGGEDKKVSFFDHRASGFLKNAMAKGMSWRMSENHLEDCNIHGAGDTETQNNHSDSKKKRRKKGLSSRIIVTEDETPARRLVMKMLDLQDQLEAVNNKIMSGLAVDKDDWKNITKLTSRLDRTFNTEVEFEWDVERHYEESLRDLMPSDMAGTTHTLKKEHHHTQKDNPTDAKSASKKDRRVIGMMRMSPKPHEHKDDDAASQDSAKSATKKNHHPDSQESGASNFSDEPSPGANKMYFL